MPIRFLLLLLVIHSICCKCNEIIGIATSSQNTIGSIIENNSKTCATKMSHTKRLTNHSAKECLLKNFEQNFDGNGAKVMNASFSPVQFEPSNVFCSMEFFQENSKLSFHKLFTIWTCSDCVNIKIMFRYFIVQLFFFNEIYVRKLI